MARSAQAGGGSGPRGTRGRAHKPADFDVFANVRRIVRMLLAYHGMTQAELAAAMGVSQQTASELLSDAPAGRPHARKIHATEVYQLAQIFDLDPSVFFQPAGSVPLTPRGGSDKKYYPTFRGTVPGDPERDAA